MVAAQDTLDPQRFTDYLAYFGLSADPFDSANSAYFQFGRRRQTLSQLLHLCQFSSGFLVVVGEAGVGISTLKQALADHLDREDIVCEIDVPVLTACETVLKNIVQQLNIAVTNSADGQINERETPSSERYIWSIDNHVKSAQTKDQLKVLLVEQAHNLDDLTLQALVKLARPDAQTHRQLHVVLFGEPQLSQRVQYYESQAFMVKQFRIEPFNREELKAYLRFRLQSVGFEGIFPFKDEDLQFLWDISHGLPAAVHDAAREILIELATPPPEPKSIGLPVGHMALIITLVAVLLVAVFYRGSSDEAAGRLTSDTGSPGMEVTDAAAAAGSDAMVSEEDSQSVVAATSSQQGAIQTDPVQQDPKQQQEGLTMEASTIPSQAKEGGDVSELDVDSGQTQEADSPSPLASDNATTADANTAPEPEPTPLASDPADLQAQAEAELQGLAQGSQADEIGGLATDEQRLLALAPEDFTLQVLASGSEQAVRDYLGRQPNRAELAVFSTERNGETVFIVVAGRFESSQAARSAVDDLPQEQRRAGPWPRSLQSVQADIRSKPQF